MIAAIGIGKNEQEIVCFCGSKAERISVEFLSFEYAVVFRQQCRRRKFLQHRDLSRGVIVRALNCKKVVLQIN